MNGYTKMLKQRLALQSYFNKLLSLTNKREVRRTLTVLCSEFVKSSLLFLYLHSYSVVLAACRAFFVL